MSSDPSSKKREAARWPEDGAPVPKLPRSRGIKLSLPEILRIVMLAAMLVAVLMLRRPCAESAGMFLESFEPPPDASSEPVHTGLPPGKYIRLSGDMSEEELREKLQLVDQDDEGDAGVAAAEPAKADDSADDGDSEAEAGDEDDDSSDSGKPASASQEDREDVQTAPRPTP
ncbi:hypothetical protein [Haliangium ochraceum]|uniref:Uncharacterized protein n=1 Tax=Haliangium ochraceum (strain DSM 14365 / JCM 11303 / SMP-2) TaxID=502025 RepID=D0LWD2_HALO1|nr:hypothetical protein [Haliangium ochraceum]ACY16064.1 hypothetical protein Hoch_3562 [Haliangium ochraceum DSM 14365]